MKLPRIPRIPYWYLLVVPASAFAIGFLSNALVMAANGGQMPVLWPGGGCGPDMMGNDIIHSCMTHATRFKYLADWIVINHFGIASPGDFGEWFYEATVLPALTAWVALMWKDHVAPIFQF